MDPGGEGSQSYFSAARAPLDTTLDELKLLQQQLRAGSPSRGPLLQRQQPIVPTIGASPYWYVDPRANQPAQNANDLSLIRQLQLLPANTPKILMNSRRLPRFAGERDDLMNDVETAIYGSPKPTPTPTPQTKYFPVSYFT